MDIWKELRDEGVDSGLLDEVRRFREAHPLTPEAQERVPVPKYLYYGREVWESAAAALLCGEHLLLAGPKATGKNVLAEAIELRLKEYVEEKNAKVEEMNREVEEFNVMYGEIEELCKQVGLTMEELLTEGKCCVCCNKETSP